MSPYTLIKGELHIYYPNNRNGPQPDGDTIKFRPDNRGLIENLPRAGRPPKFTSNPEGITTIRFDGIDALETHFKDFHQHQLLALEARDKLLEYTGFGNVEYYEDKPFVAKSVENHPIRGYLLSNGLDAYGRVIAFVFTGEHPNVDGSSILVQPDMLEEGLNAEMLRQGHAYPAFYLSLPANLREYLKEGVAQARDSGIGLWPTDTSMSSTITGIEQLQDLAIWPKLFRRLASFYADGHTDLAGFHRWLLEDPEERDDRLLLPNSELRNMHDLIQVSGNNVTLLHPPEDVVIVPDDYDPSARPQPHAGVGSIRIVGALINTAESPEAGNETVTILNTTSQNINLKGWHIADNNGSQELGGNLAQGETRRVRLNEHVQLSNRRDTITILGASTSSNVDNIIDQVSYEAQDLPPEGHTAVF